MLVCRPHHKRGHRPLLLQATSGQESSFRKARPYSVTGRMRPAAGHPRQAPGPEWTSDDWAWLRWLDSRADCTAPVIAAPQVLVSTPLKLYLLRIIYWAVHYFHRLCTYPLFTYSHTNGLRLKDVLCAPPISTLHVHMAAGPQTPSHPDTLTYYFARLQDVLTIEWLPQGMPDGSYIYRFMVPGTPPGHYLQERGAPHATTRAPGPRPSIASRAAQHPTLPHGRTATVAPLRAHEMGFTAHQIGHCGGHGGSATGASPSTPPRLPARVPRPISCRLVFTTHPGFTGAG